ncbi:FtsX-like permease family protein [Pseudoalteromonas piscicida]|uniref:ABC transporter permease n=1 Tax=Pseudoalteromonas piscicida TaxID=43662 RepID=UPI0027399FE4|nr:FtsX-like permease family protein [Pseudoalteromonas piscicida]MDP4489881.1 FtsX-like permease family protein [Pseudoalteromonas piscicida]
MLELKPIINALLRSKVGAVLAILQLALTLAIVSNSLSIISERVTYLNKPTGYPEESIITFSVMSFDDKIDANQQLIVDERILKSIPGVIEAVGVSSVPLSGGGSNSGFSLTPEDDGKHTNSGHLYANEQVIRTLGVKLIEGRNFTSGDVLISSEYAKQPDVVIASKAFTDEIFGEGKGLGQTIYYGGGPLKVVGIVERMTNAWPRFRNADRLIIFPMVNANGFQDFLVRTDPSLRGEVMKKIEAALLQENPSRVITGIKGLDEVKGKYNSKDLLMLRMLLVLITALVVVTALGIFGLTQFNISKRTKQIGTRRALGARKSAIVRYFVVENLIVCAIGLVLGTVATVFLGQKLMSLYSVPPLEVSYILITALGLIVLCIASVIFPAKKAANISPSIATRSV